MEKDETAKPVTPSAVPAEPSAELAGCKACGAEPEPGFPLPLCSNCRTKLARRPIPIGIKLAGALVRLLIIFALTRIPKSMRQSVKDVSPVTRLLVMPIVGVIYLATIGRFFWLDLFYGIGVAIGLPTSAVAIYSCFV